MNIVERSATLFAITLSVIVGTTFAAAATVESPPAPPEFQPQHLIVASSDPILVLRGRDAQRQLLVTGVAANGDQRDWTRRVTFETTPPGIVTVNARGVVVPIADGAATIAVAAAGVPPAKVEVRVEHVIDDLPVSFPNQVVPIFTKLACNSGGCHGKATGQNGFKLSLLGFEPAEDYEHLVKESRGRRVFPASPDQSLLLQKPINAMPHGGGQRLEADSADYRTLRRWIAQGMPYGTESDPKLQRIEVVPNARTLALKGEQQIAVLAHYTDGAVEDVTAHAQYDPNNGEMAAVSPQGLVSLLGLAGDVAIMARYQGFVDTFRATAPLGASMDAMPPARNFIDEHVFAKLVSLGVPPTQVCDDATFLRRLTIDIAGRLPTLEETNAFLADADPEKRAAAIERLLSSDDYAANFATKWNAILRNQQDTPTYARGVFAFHDWIRDSLRQNMPYDEFARAIIAATGEIGADPPVAWYREVRATEQQVEDVAQLFLGMRIQCARCHHHPFEKWSQRDYYSMAAFFSQVQRKPGAQTDEQRIFHARGLATATHPKTGEKLPPAGLDAQPVELTPDEDPRQLLVDWMSEPNNKFFGPALVNRYWKHFFSRGLVDPEDDMRVTNPASNPALLNALSQNFIESGFDLKQLVRTICNSSTYQLGSQPNEFNLSDRQNHSRFYPRRLAAETLLDALDSLTGTTTDFAGLPLGTRAMELPDTNAASYFLTVFGRPEGDSACECERSAEANLAQSLHLLNSNDVQQKLSSDRGRAAQMAADEARGDEGKVQELYLRAYGRPARPDELSTALAHITGAANKRQAYEDIIWALANTKEFLFNH